MKESDYLVIVDIPAHPDFPNLTRKVGCHQYQHSHKEKTIKIYTDVFWFKDGLPYAKQGVKPFERVITAMNGPNRKVDPVDGRSVYIDTIPNPAYNPLDPESTEPEILEVWRRWDTDAIVANPVDQYAFFKAYIDNTDLRIPTVLSNFILSEALIYQSYDK
jgi:hypothetical protein